MKKYLAFLLTVVMSLSLLVGCGDKVTKDNDSSDADNDNTYATPEFEFSMGSNQANTTPLAQGGAYFCEKVFERTNGRVKINFFPDSAIGSEKDCLVQVSNNELEFELGGVTVIDMFAPEYGFLNAPYLLKDMDHLMNLMNGDLGSQFKDKLKSSNIAMLGCARVGVRQLTSNKEIKGVEDLTGLKLRLPEIATWTTIWSALGASPMTIAVAERYQALQNGVADASEGTLDQVIDYNLYEVQKYAYITNHVCEFGSIYASEATLASLPDDVRKVIEDTAVEAMDYSSKLADEYLQTCITKLAELNLTPVELDTTEFNKIAMEACDELFQSTWTVTTKDEIMSYAQ